MGQAPVALRSASNFAVLAGSTVTNVVSCTPCTVVTGDLGLSPGTSVTGFPPGIVIGAPYVDGILPDPTAVQAQVDLTTAYNDAAGRTLNVIVLSTGELGGRTLAPGLYKAPAGSLDITLLDLTLDAGGDANAVWIFQMPSSTLTVVSGRQVILTGGAQANNIYWQVGSSATLGTTSVFKGTILAQASVTLATGASLEGRALARVGAVTLDANAVTKPAAPGAVATIIVRPNPITLAIGSTRQFTATGKDASGNVVAIAPTWSVVAGGGTIDNTTGLFNAGAVAGAFTDTVKASSGAVSGSATVTVIVGQAPVALRSASNFAVLAGSTVTNVVSCTPCTVVTGDLGLSPGTSVTGFAFADGGPGILNGAPYVDGILPDPTAVQAQVDLTTAYNDAAGRTLNVVVLDTGELGGRTLTPGLYQAPAGSFDITLVDLTLDAGGDVDAVWIFQMPLSTLTVVSGRKVILAGGAQARNIYWQVGSAATLGTTSDFKGTILAQTSITLATGASLEGRALAQTAAVALDANAVTKPN
ncbi:MAG: ice-binding family protein [Chloroflexota bacterium]|nr:ice-binding family protein [Chloroflexota bacterium]